MSNKFRFKSFLEKIMYSETFVPSWNGLLLRSPYLGLKEKFNFSSPQKPTANSIYLLDRKEYDEMIPLYKILNKEYMEKLYMRLIVNEAMKKQLLKEVDITNYIQAQ